MSSCGTSKRPHEPKEVQDVSPPHVSSSQPSKRRSVKRVNPPAEPEGHAALHFAEEEERGGLFSVYVIC